MYKCACPAHPVHLSGGIADPSRRQILRIAGITGSGDNRAGKWRDVLINHLRKGQYRPAFYAPDR